MRGHHLDSLQSISDQFNMEKISFGSEIDTVKGLMVSEHLAGGCLLTGAHEIFATYMFCKVCVLT